MLKWIHKLLNPHCPDCRQEELEKRACSNCEVLRQLLETEKFENKQLLERMLYIPKETLSEGEIPKPIRTAPVSMRIRREILEGQDRKQAALLKEKAKDIEELEKELGVQDAS